MNHTLSFCLALLLGIVAATINWLWVSAQARPERYVAVQAGVAVGDEITETILVGIPIPGNPAELRRSLVPFTNRSLLFGVTARRELAAGDIVFQRDIQAPVESSQWEVIGPFRLISVGERFSQDDSYAARSGDNNVTIAVNEEFDDKTRRLLEVLSPQAVVGKNDTAMKIVAVQVVPTQANKPTGNRSVEGLVYQTVSLQGIANVPRVLLEGDMIRFVIPASPSY